MATGRGCTRPEQVFKQNRFDVHNFPKDGTSARRSLVAQVQGDSSLPHFSVPDFSAKSSSTFFRFFWPQPKN
jgi:hypothetical protein